MDRDPIARVEIDGEGRLHVVPATQEFPLIYRSGIEINWDSQLGSLISPKPRVWPYTRWFEQILAAASLEYGCNLFITDDTVWANVDPGIKAGLLSVARNGA